MWIPAKCCLHLKIPFSFCLSWFCLLASCHSFSSFLCSWLVLVINAVLLAIRTKVPVVAHVVFNCGLVRHVIDEAGSQPRLRRALRKHGAMTSPDNEKKLKYTSRWSTKLFYSACEHSIKKFIQLVSWLKSISILWVFSWSHSLQMTPYDESDFNLQMSFAFCGLRSVHEILGFFPPFKINKMLCGDLVL